MLKKSFIFGFMVTLCAYSTAQAQTACETVDNVLRSVAVVKDMDSERSQRTFSEVIFELEGLVEQISVPVLTPQSTGNTLDVQRAVTSQYVSNMRDAIVAAESGYENYAKQTLRNGLNTDFTQSIETLTGYWNCNPAEEDNRPDTEAETIQTVYRSAPKDRVETRTVQRPRIVEGESMARNRSANGGVMQQANLDRGQLLEANAMVFLLMIGFFILVGLFFYVQNRTKKFKAREARRLVQLPVQVRVDKDNYAALVVDISMNGLKMQHPDAINGQRKLSVQIGGSWHVGQIMWSNKMFAGIKFKKPIDRQTYTAFLS